MLIEHLASEFEKLQSNIETGKAPFDQQQALTLEFYEKRITALETRIEQVRDQIASLKANGGNNL
jgi:phage shock protein A